VLSRISSYRTDLTRLRFLAARYFFFMIAGLGGADRERQLI
jgi:hypothetical protein